MANNYVLFSAEIGDLTPGEFAWLSRFLHLFPLVSDEGYCPVDYVLEPKYTSMWLYSMESADLEFVADVVQRFLRRWRPDQGWGMEWAETCSRPRVGEFGGGAVWVTAHRIEWCTTGAWLYAIKTAPRQ